MERPCICYKTKEPTYYNKGTKYESSCDEFLLYQCFRKIEEVQAEVDRLNNDHPEKDFMGNKIDWNKIDYFFVNVQEEMY
jgi:hypothetical protein